MDDNEPQYLLIRRRDSLGYVDFLRGKYALSNSTYIATLLAAMTREELSRLLTRPFDELWTNLWNAQNTRQFRLEHESAKRIFESFKSTGDISGKTLSRYIAEVPTSWEEPEWGFPKGRRSPHESELACAIREFAEETGIPTKDLRIRTGFAPEREEYVGTNGISYRHIYYLADCNTDAILNATNRVQTREVGDIGWFSFADGYLRIRDTNPEKRAVLGRVHARLTHD
jgi:8-oxo-dGTP pyrophosphatase MutT (NUDIX family)